MRWMVALIHSSTLRDCAACSPYRHLDGRLESNCVTQMTAGDTGKPGKIACTQAPLAMQRLYNKHVGAAAKGGPGSAADGYGGLG